MEKTSLHVVLLSAIFIAMSLLSASAPAYSGGSGRQKDEISRLTVQVVASIAHNPRNFTQGLLYHRGKLYESTGLVGQSSLQRIDAKTGKVEKNMAVPGVFAEGLALFENRLVQLTWRDKTAFVYDFPSFAKIGAFKHRTEGWGLTDDGRRLIMSDGSDTLFFRNPFSFAIERKIPVTLQGAPLRRINELEYAEGKIYANVWQEIYIVRIDPSDGTVDGVIDAGPLFSHLSPLSGQDIPRPGVLNGIAYNDDTKTFYLTGKNWPLIFEVELVANEK